MMTSSNGNFFRVTGLLCGEFTGHQWIPSTKRPVTRKRFPLDDVITVESQHKGQWRGALMFSSICSWINGWVNNREAGDLRRHRAHNDVIVMKCRALMFVLFDSLNRLIKNNRVANYFRCPNARHYNVEFRDCLIYFYRRDVLSKNIDNCGNWRTMVSSK